MYKEQVKIEDTAIDFEYCYTRVYIKDKNEISPNLINITNDFMVDKGLNPFYTLKQIYDLCKDKYPNTMIYVVEDTGTQGTIYCCGNYEDGIWVEYAKTIGYA